jgi:hypothetical protein
LGRFAAPAFEGGVRCPPASSEARELLVGSLLAGASTGSCSAPASESRREPSTVDSGRHLEGIISARCSKHAVKRTGVVFARGPGLDRSEHFKRRFFGRFAALFGPVRLVE